MPLTSRAEKSLILFECSYWFRSWNLGFFMGWNVHGDCTQDKRKLVVHPRRNDLLSSCIAIHHPFGGLSSLAQPDSGVDSLRFKYWMSIEIPREERFWCLKEVMHMSRLGWLMPLLGDFIDPSWNYCTTHHNDQFLWSSSLTRKRISGFWWWSPGSDASGTVNFRYFFSLIISDVINSLNLIFDCNSI